jgi:PAS domain S-box-containing protein
MNPTRLQNGNLINSALPGKFSSVSKKFLVNSNYGRRFLSVIALAGLYFAAARLGLSLASVHTNVSPVWPPTGIAIAAVLLLGYRAWPGILLGAFLANLLTPVSIATSVGIAVGNTMEALSAGFLLRSVDFHKSFDRARDVFKFVVAALLCTMLAATIGDLSLCLGHSAQWQQFGALWVTWWLGDLTGALTVGPLLLTWGIKSREWLPKRRYLEAVLLLSLLSVAAIATFGKSGPTPLHYYPLTRLIVPFFLWAAFRLGHRGVTLATMTISVFAVLGTVLGLGPFVDRTPNEALLQLQLFVGSNAVMFLFLVAVVEERRRSQDSLRENDRRLAGNLAITRILAESPALSDATRRILQTIGETLDWEVGAMWTPDADGKVLRCLTVWHTPSVAVNKFESTSRAQTFTPGIGLPGRVWTSLKPGWIPDVARDDNFPRAPNAIAEGLHAAFAFPIVFGEKFLGVMEFFSRKIREPDNALLAMFGSIGNQIGQFMERKRAEEALLQNREWLRMTMEGSRMGTWARDLDGGNRVLWSPELERIFGLSPGEFPGTEAAFFDFVHPDDRESLTEAVRQAIENHTDYNIEFRYAPKGGGLRWMLGRGRALYDTAGKPYRLAGLGWDITERKQAEEERERLLAREQAARTEAQIANRTKDEFLAMLSHELRTPLTSMLGWLEMIRGGSLDAATTDYAIETVERNAQTQAQLIEDLVDISRIVSGKLSLEIRPMDLAPVVEAAVDVVRPAADAKGIQIEIVRDPFARAVSGDPARLQQIFWNLLSNAIKFTARGGSVYVTLRHTDSSVEVTVQDTGQGIGPEFLPHVFERFRQAESSLTRSHRGLGLGLAIVRHLVELHGGTVRAQSPGESQGSTFTVSLPLVGARTTLVSDALVSRHQSAAHMTVVSNDVLKGLRVLVVEDESDARELLSVILKRSGATVKAVESAQEALRSVPLFRPSVLLSDIGLPAESGYELIRKIRTLPSEAAQLPAVALTAYATEKDRELALSAGYQIHLAKPVDPNHVVEAIARLVGRNHEK